MSNAVVPAMPEPRNAAQAIGTSEERGREQHRRQSEESSEECLPAILTDRRIHLEVDRIRPGRAAYEERGKRVAGEQQIRLDMGRITEVPGEEVVQALWRLASSPASQTS